MNIAKVILTILLAATSFGQVLAPDHDLRLAIKLDTPKAEIAKFYDVYYGDTIRLGEFGCGDPRFLIHVNQTPTFTASGYLNQDGQHGTSLQLGTGYNAKIYEQCLGFDQPSVGGSVRIGTNVGVVSSADTLQLNGTADIGALGSILGINFPFSTSVPLPAVLNSGIPISLGAGGDAELDFGQLVSDQWQSAGHQKTLRLHVNFGSFGGAPSDNSYLAVDGTWGGTLRTHAVGSLQQSQAHLESDFPLWDNAGVGVSFGESFWGTMNKNTRLGLMSEILPIRVKARREFHFLFWKLNREFEVVLNEGEIQYVEHEGERAIRAQLGSTHARIRKIKNGQPVSGKDKRVKSIRAHVLFDRVRLDSSNLKFRVADFRVDIKFRWFMFPIRLSSGQLEASLNGGTLPIFGTRPKSAVELPECVDTNYEKFKARKGACGMPPGEQKIYWLSFESGIRRRVFVLDVPNAKMRWAGNVLQIGVPLLVED